MLAFRSDSLKFLDILSFTAKCPLRQYCKNYAPQLKETKSYIPYEFCTSFASLQVDHLPAYDDFKSQLYHNKNILELEMEEYSVLLENGTSPAHALKKLGLSEKPKSGNELYSELQTQWRNRGYKTLLDMYCDYLKRVSECSLVPYLL